MAVESTSQEPVFKDESETIDLTPAIPAPATGGDAEFSLEQVPADSLPETADSKITTASDFPVFANERAIAPHPLPASTGAPQAENASFPSGQEKASPASTAYPASRLSKHAGYRSGPGTPANRLADSIRDLIQSTVSAQESIAAERLVKTLESRMAGMQLAVLGRLTEQMQSLVSAQTNILKQRAEEITSESQQALSVRLRQMTEAAGQNARAVQGEAVSAIEKAMDSLHNQVAEQLPQMEKKFLEQCRSLAEQSLSGIVENSLQTMSARIEEASKGFERVEERTRKILFDTSEQLGEHAATKIDETTKHMEEQLKDMAQCVSSNLQQYSVEELGKRQQTVEAAFRKQMQAVSESSLQEVQGALARMLHGLAEKMRPAKGQDVNDRNTP